MLENGERALVTGGRYGIDLPSTVQRLIFHMHPWDDLATGPSDADFAALKALKQASTWLYEHGQWIKFWAGDK